MEMNFVQLRMSCYTDVLLRKVFLKELGNLPSFRNQQEDHQIISWCNFRTLSSFQYQVLNQRLHRNRHLPPIKRV